MNRAGRIVGGVSRFWIAACVGLWAAVAPAQSVDYCDPGLPRGPDDSLAYRNRPQSPPDRCEGVFIQEVAALGWLRVASLLTAAPRAVAEGDSVLLSWTPPGAGRPVHLRAQGFGRDYYRMDTRPSGPSFRWSTDVLRASGRSIEDLGIAAWTTARLDGAERRLYLPVSLGSAAAPAAGELVLDLEPAQELQEVYVSVARTGPDGVAAHYLRDGSEELGYGYYPAGERLRVALGPIDAAGTYRVEVASLLANGTLASHELWFLSGD